MGRNTLPGHGINTVEDGAWLATRVGRSVLRSLDKGDEIILDSVEANMIADMADVGSTPMVTFTTVTEPETAMVHKAQTLKREVATPAT